MDVALVKPTTERATRELFAAARDRLPGSGPVSEARQAAFDDFARRGLPYRRIEEWKYTDLRTLLREIAPLAAAPDQAALARAGEAVTAYGAGDAYKLVLVDGVFAPKLSDQTPENGVEVRALREVLENNEVAARADLLTTTAASDTMISLNTAMATDGIVIDVAENAKLTRPLHIVHIATQSSTAAFTRSSLRLANGAQATLVESFVAAEGAEIGRAHV